MAAMRSLTEVKVPRRIAWRDDDAEEDLDHVQPGARGRCEVHRDARVLGQPGLDGGVFVGGVVVRDDVQLDPRVGLGDQLQEAEELGMGVSLVAGVGHLACRDLQGREQGRGAVADVMPTSA